MEGFQPLGRPFLFLGVFALVAVLLLPVWIYLSEYYMVGLIALVDVATGCAGVPARFQLSAFAGDDVFTPSIVAGVALFIATPNRSAGWKLHWIIRLAALFALSHAILLFLQVQISFARALSQSPPAQRLLLERQALLPLLQDGLIEHLVDISYHWIYPALDTLVWFAAVQGRADSAQRILSPRTHLDEVKPVGSWRRLGTRFAGWRRAATRPM
jgi:hypothetical protein